MDRNALGTLGEDVAALFLASRGYRVLARNLRRGRNEIDLLAERGALLVVVEVKWRRATSADAAGESPWRGAQRRRARDVALALLAERPDAAARPLRFDLVTIVESPEGWRVVHRRAAWAPAGGFW